MDNDSTKNHQQDDDLRQTLEALLLGNLKTEVEPRAYEHEDILNIISRLQSIDENDFLKKLITAGFTSKPYNIGSDPEDDQACETCMYYLVHRQFCDLPELMLPVKENWSCRLWRI